MGHYFANPAFSGWRYWDHDAWFICMGTARTEDRAGAAKADRCRPQSFHVSGLVHLIINVLLLAIFIELIGTVLLGSYFLSAGYQQEWYTAFFHGYFISVSAFTNAGFGIYGNSLHQFAQDYYVQLINIVLIICGAIGFPVLMELQNYLLHRRNKMKFTFSLFTKITTLTFFLLVVSGTIFFYFFERDGFLQDKSWHESFFLRCFILFHREAAV